MSIATYQTDETRGKPLNEKTCLVTGASRGIGRSIAIELAEKGANVGVNYRTSESAARDVAHRIEAFGENAAIVQSDVSEMNDVQRMAEDVRAELGRIDVLVNNAGITADNRFEEMSRDEWDRVIDVNLGGTFNCTKAFYEDIRSSESGRIINIASVVGQRGNYGQANYAASKSGLFGLTRTLALELASSGATANCVAPGFTETEMLSEVPDRVRDIILNDIPANRFATPEDIAGIVRFLASNDSRYLTGQVIGINGGMEC